MDQPQHNLYVLCGLPYSGKSTVARTKSYPIVSPDALRMRLYGRKFDPRHESGVWWMVRLFIESLFTAGHHSVVLDACSITQGRRLNWASNELWRTFYVPMPADAEECIRRAEKAGNATVIPMIHRMATQQEPLSREEAFSAIDPFSDEW